ncbi:MAG: hypothetical protein ACLQK4_09840 [Acidimicrobiales bacterium]
MTAYFESAWERRGSRSDGAPFTVSTYGRYMVYDPIHHLNDVNALLEDVLE